MQIEQRRRVGVGCGSHQMQAGPPRRPRWRSTARSARRPAAASRTAPMTCVGRRSAARLGVHTKRSRKPESSATIAATARRSPARSADKAMNLSKIVVMRLAAWISALSPRGERRRPDAARRAQAYTAPSMRCDSFCASPCRLTHSTSQHTITARSTYRASASTHAICSRSLLQQFLQSQRYAFFASIDHCTTDLSLLSPIPTLHAPTRTSAAQLPCFSPARVPSLQLTPSRINLLPYVPVRSPPTSQCGPAARAGGAGRIAP